MSSETLPQTSTILERIAGHEAQLSQRRFDNGLLVFHLPTPHSAQFQLGMVIRAGTRFEEAAHPGVAHFLEHMMFRGSERHPRFIDLAEAFERLGGDWNAATDHESTQYWYSGIQHNWPQAVELFAEFLERPRLNDLEVERSVILRELEGETNESGHSTDLQLHAARLLWPASSLARPILGTVPSINTISLRDLERHRDQLYAPRNMALCAIGGDPGQVLDALEGAFSSHRVQYAASPRPLAKPTQAAAGPLVRWVDNSDNEYRVQLSFGCEGEWSPQAPAYDLVARLLSDGFCARLSRRLREELGLVYDVDAHSSLYSDAGMLSVVSSVKLDQIDRFFGELYAILGQLASQGPTEEELERVRTRALVELELAVEHPAELCLRQAWARLNGRSDSLLEEHARLSSLDRDQLRERCGELFHPERAVLVALGPRAEGLEQRLLGLLRQGLRF